MHTVLGAYLLYGPGALCIQICSWSIAYRILLQIFHAPGAYPGAKFRAKISQKHATFVNQVITLY